MKSISTLIFAILFITNTILAEIENKSDELTLRNQLFADVFLLKEGVDRLQISVEVLNKRFSNQMEILKGLQTRLAIDETDSEAEDGVCDRITGMFNTTLRKHNILENRLITKLEDMREDQTTRLDEIILKQKLNKNCASPDASTTTVSLMEKMIKFEEKLNSQQTQFDKFVSDHLNILQDINGKLSRTQEQFEKIGKELNNLKELKTDVNKVITYPRPEWPMELILGLSSSNITSSK